MNNANRPRSNSVTSIKDYLKRKREKTVTEDYRVATTNETSLKHKKTRRNIREGDLNNTMMEDLKLMIQTLTADVHKGFQDNNSEIKKLKEDIEKREQQWREEKLELTQKLNLLEIKLQKQDTIIEKLENQLEIQEKNKKIHNIIIKGLQLPNNNLETNIETFLNQELNTEVNVTEAFKVGKKSDSMVIVAKLKSRTQKQLILTNKNKLKGKSVYIENDLTKAELEIQSILRQHANEELKKGRKAKIAYQKLYVDNELYIWNKKQKQLIKQINFTPTKN
ncbi:hypothetical protein RN001_003103 [Aquatica leii]|uniref:Uncharacterized protein n=1 Tax=Aquatica leii TaxID=1421715 RepID=A0AAN7SKJ1_9COLE|nr:hypothetical protein RN001_003103 [Aquatica leii]